MKPKQAIDELTTMLGNRGNVTDKRLKKIIPTLAAHLKMLEVDNKRLRKKERRQRQELRVYKDIVSGRSRNE